MAISPQRLTIYLYSTHRAVIFAIAQLSCLSLVCIHECVQRAILIRPSVRLSVHGNPLSCKNGRTYRQNSFTIECSKIILVFSPLIVIIIPACRYLERSGFHDVLPLFSILSVFPRWVEAKVLIHGRSFSTLFTSPLLRWGGQFIVDSCVEREPIKEVLKARSTVDHARMHSTVDNNLPATCPAVDYNSALNNGLLCRLREMHFNKKHFAILCSRLKPCT